MESARPAARREIFGWVMYDWANSAFQTTVLTVLIGPYLTGLAQQQVGPNGVVLNLGPLGAVTATSMFPYCISLSVFLQVMVLPVVGAIADSTGARKGLMATACYAGVIATCLLFFVAGDRVLLGGVLLILANVGYGLSIALYNAFLNDVATGEERDRVSSRGYAFGYFGGGLLLAANLWLLSTAEAIGISIPLAIRLSLLSAGLWWGGFALLTFTRLRRRAPVRPRPPGRSYLTIASGELRDIWRHLGRLRHTRRFLFAYMAYNDGIQTVIAIASVFLAQELFVTKGRPADVTFLAGLVLMVQFVAFGGALLFERIAAGIGTKHAIVLSLALWIGIVLYAYGLLETVGQAWAMGAVLAVVLGGSQALSRALFSQMIPEGHEASFFGLYEITERGTSWLGPFLFGVVVSVTGSYRNAILSLIALFAGGLAMLIATDTDRAVAEAGRASGRDAACADVT